MGTIQNSFFRAGMPLVLAVLNGCALSSSNGNPDLHIDLSSYQDRSGQFALLNGGSLLQGLAPPQAATGFSCYGVNVTGPGIGDSSIHPEADPMLTFQKTLAGDYCTYRGVVTPPIHLNTTTGGADAALQVPPGGVRLVQVFGVNDPTVCTIGNFGNESSSVSNTGGSKLFELGRGIVTDLFSDRSVEITSAWPSVAGLEGDLSRGARALDCGGSCIYPINGTLAGLASYTSALSITALTGTIYLAQRFTVPTTTYLRRAEVAILAGTGIVVTASVYESLSALLTSAEIAAGPVASASATVVSNNTASMVNFDFYDPVYFYRALYPGKNYFVVFSVTTGTAAFKAAPALGTVGSVSTFPSGGSVFTVTTPSEIFMKINACN